MKFFLPYRSILIALPDDWIEDHSRSGEYVRYDDPQSPFVFRVRREDFRLDPVEQNAVGLREFSGNPQEDENCFNPVFDRVIKQLRQAEYDVDDTLRCFDDGPLLRYWKDLNEDGQSWRVRSWVRGVAVERFEFTVVFFSFLCPVTHLEDETVPARIEMLERSILACELMSLQQAVGLDAETGGKPLAALTGLVGEITGKPADGQDPDGQDPEASRDGSS